MTLRHEDLTVEGIKQVYLDCDNDEAKYETLIKFYGMLTIGSSIIFVKVWFHVHGSYNTNKFYSEKTLQLN